MTNVIANILICIKSIETVTSKKSQKILTFQNHPFSKKKCLYNQCFQNIIKNQSLPISNQHKPRMCTVTSSPCHGPQKYLNKIKNVSQSLLSSPNYHI